MMKQWNEATFVGYLAGFLDGEGCIDIRQDECATKVRLANTVKDVLEAILDRLGYGRIIAYRRPKPHWKQLYCYEVTNAPDVERLLKLVRPFLIIKAQRTDQALAIIARQRARMDDLDTRNREILARLATGALQKTVAAEFGVSQQYVSRIKAGHTWPCEIARFNARRGLKKSIRPSDAIFRLHGCPTDRYGQEST